MIVTVLAVFKIDKPIDDSGCPAELDVRMTSGMISFPHPFSCKLTSRSTHAASLVREQS